MTVRQVNWPDAPVKGDARDASPDQMAELIESAAAYPPGLEQPAPITHIRPVEEWTEPNAVLGLPPAPQLDLTLLPAEIERITTDAAERLQCPPDYVAFSTLTGIAGLIGRRIGIRPRQRDEWTERAALWTTLIGLPSWMKTPGLEEAPATTASGSD